MQFRVLKFMEYRLALLTKRGRPPGRTIPADADCAGLIGSMKGRIRVKGDILSTGIRWNDGS
jgi:hypothetical protein